VRCAEEIPLVRAAQEKHRDRDLIVIWVTHQDRVEKLIEYARKNNVPDFVYDPDDSVSRKFGMTYGGGVVFVNPEGVVKSRVPKGISASSLAQELKKIL
jgi:hypothetical protein